MLKKIRVTLVLLVLAAPGFSQTGVIKVRLIDGDTKEGIPFANVVAFSGGEQAGGATTNMDGEALIKPLNPGKYIVKATYVGFQPVEMTGIIVSADKTSYIDIPMSKGLELPVITIKYDKPLIRPDNIEGMTFTREDFRNLSAQNLGSIIGGVGGVVNSGGNLHFGGSRSGTDVYIDGIKTLGMSVPLSAVEEINVITGGIPAQYGDVTGAVTSITTRGPESQYRGEIRMESSKFLDPFATNYMNMAFSGPILKKRDTAENVFNSVLGFIVSASFSYDKDNSPSAIGAWKVKDDKLKELEENPLRPNPYGAGFIKNADYLRMDDLEHMKAHENSPSKNIQLAGRLQYKPNKNLYIIFGGGYNYINNKGTSNSITNYKKNPVGLGNNFQLFSILTQRFGTQTENAEEKEKATANILNAYYKLDVSYEKDKSISQDAVHKDRVFDYGYIGKFEHHKMPLYVYRSDTVYGDGMYMLTEQDVLLTFTPSDLNPVATNWTKQFYALNSDKLITSDNDLLLGLGLRNGDNPSTIYGLFASAGAATSNYSKSENDRLGIKTSFSADIKKHAIQIGLEFEQRTSRAYGINTYNLWSLMRRYTNSHISEYDFSNPIYVPELSGTLPYYKYNRKYNANTQTYFDKNLRKKLGLPVDNTNWIDTDSYDPSLYSIDMFSADELIEKGNPSVNYNGYDYTGKKIKGATPFEDYFNKRDANGNYVRSIGAFQPIYMGGYIQDKFDFRDMKFLVGLRVDRFDANQKVLKDKFLMDEAKTAGEVTSINGQTVTHPSNIGNDYVVYVDDIKNPKNILGYRNSNTWYNASGKEISDPDLIESPLGIAPYLVNPSNYDSTQRVTAGAFKDYVPQVSVMPRISFSFPISDVATFFAHYDIYTLRPANNRMNPFSYLYVQERGNAQIANPDLKPQKTIDYRFGYNQKLSAISAISFTVFYREMRDMIHQVKITGAYPADYFTFDNIDFSTAKGLIVTYALRRYKGVQLDANYTLQFADATASAAGEGFNLLNSDVPNIRTLSPTEWDQRHAVKIIFDYRFESGEDYNGPAWAIKAKDGKKSKRILENSGINLTFQAASGTPYTRQSNYTTIESGVSQDPPHLHGSIRGSNLPWTYYANLKVDKAFDVKFKREDQNGERKKLNFDVYIAVQNIFNRINILYVYPATGNPEDDGYLTSARAQSHILAQNDPQSFKDLYKIAVNSQYNYSVPRTIQLGVNIGF